MLLLTNTTAQTLTAGQSLTFDEIISQSGCGECCNLRRTPTSVKLRGTGLYEISFKANISGAVAETPVQLSFTLGGSELPETRMISTPAVADTYNCVNALTGLKISCNDYDRISITNTGTADVTVDANSALFIKRLA